MTSIKRVAPRMGLRTQIRARAMEDEWDTDDDSPSPGEEGVDEQDSASERDARQSDDENESDVSSQDEDDSEESDSEDAEDDGPSSLDVAQVSFGALARVQESMSSTNRKTASATDNYEPEDYSNHSREPKPGKRSSKYAPIEVTSKKPVTRRRDVVTMPSAPIPRDPRFFPLPRNNADSRDRARATVQEIKAARAYAFLDEYRAEEVKELRQAMRKTKTPEARAKLERMVKSLEEKQRAAERKARQRAVLAEHRRREKELVAQGKRPFYLKKSEKKKLVLTEQFAGMKNKQADKAMERRRKKLASREKKRLPMERRTAEDRRGNR